MGIDPNKILANPTEYTSSAVRNAQKQVTSAKKKKKKKKKNDNNNNTTEPSTADKLGSLSELAKLAAGDGLQGLDPSGSHGNEEGAVASIQYSTLDKEVDKKQNEIRRQIEALRT